MLLCVLFVALVVPGEISFASLADLQPLKAVMRAVTGLFALDLAVNFRCLPAGLRGCWAGGRGLCS